MTKAEQKKLEMQRKRDFIAAALDTVLSCVPAQTASLRKKIEMRVVFENYNRYIRFLSYGHDLNVQIFHDGNVALELREPLHNDYNKQIFEYVDDIEEQGEFLHNLENIMSFLITLVTEQGFMDWHSYMDYVSETGDVITAYKKMCLEAGKSEE